MVTELKAGHLYKYENNASLSGTSSNYIVCSSIGKIVTDEEVVGETSANQKLGADGVLNFFGKNKIVDFVGSFYFVFESKNGDVSGLYPFITEVKDFFVYDRTQADVDYAKSVIANKGYSLTELKGCLNAFDLARIESNMKMLWEELDEWGYQMTALTYKFDWAFTEYLDNTSITKLFSNINSIADDFYRPQGWEIMPTTIKSYDDVNKIEKNIYLMKNALDEIQANAYRSGAFNSYTRNNEYYILPLRVE